MIPKVAMQKYLLAFVILTCISMNSVFAQEEPKSQFQEFQESQVTGYTMGSIAVPVAAFFISLHYLRKSVITTGMYIISFTMESFGFEAGRKKLYSRYFEGKEVSKEELDNAAQEVLINLTILKGLLEGNIRKEIVFGLYADVIIKSVDAYQKYLDETQPQYPILSLPLKKLYELAQKNIAEGKSFKAVKE